MEKSPQPPRSPLVVPLARDAAGNMLEVPEEAVGWRIRRQTGGRPRLQLDAKKQPMLFPLDYTIADVEDILPQGSYLLDLVDKNGDPIGLTIALTIQPLRNAAPSGPGDEDEEQEEPETVSTRLPVTTSDIRLVLEANVRSTQLAFQHNERTLAMGLRMAETLRDGVQVLANSQADWIKSLSSARGFYRNAPGLPAPVEVKQLTIHTGDDDGAADAAGADDNDGGPPPSPAPPQHWMDQLAPTVIALSQQILPLVANWGVKQRAGSSGATSGATVAPWEPADLVDWRRVEKKREAFEADQAYEQRVARLKQAIVDAATPGPAIDMLKLMQLMPPETLMRINAIQNQLSPEEQGIALRILQGFSAKVLDQVLVVLDGTSLEAAIDFVRRLIADWRTVMAEREAERAQTYNPSPVPPAAQPRPAPPRTPLRAETMPSAHVPPSASPPAPAAPSAPPPGSVSLGSIFDAARGFDGNGDDPKGSR